MKPWRREALGKDVSQLIICRNKFDLKIFAEYSFLDKMEVHFDMLGSSVKNRIGGYGEGRDIVTP
jgi:hypothetical protein